MEMTVTKGLQELKTLEARIEKAISNGTFVTYGKVEGDTTIKKGVTKDDAKENAKADLDSALGLMERRNNIKSAIVESNATSKVIVAGIEMSVASAIERKSSIAFDKQLLAQLKRQLADVTNRVDKKNDAMQNKIDTTIYTMVGSDKKQQGDQIEQIKSITDLIKKQDEYTIVDGIDIEALIKKMEDDILAFEGDIDTALTIANATNKITIAD